MKGRLMPGDSMSEERLDKLTRTPNPSWTADPGMRALLTDFHELLAECRRARANEAQLAKELNDAREHPQGGADKDPRFQRNLSRIHDLTAALAAAEKQVSELRAALAAIVKRREETGHPHSTSCAKDDCRYCVARRALAASEREAGHVCRDSGPVCECSPIGSEPSEKCPKHGGAFYRPRCDICSRFMPAASEREAGK